MPLPRFGHSNLKAVAIAKTIGIVGAGRVGQALGSLLGRNHIVKISSRGDAASAAAFIGNRAQAVSISELAASCKYVVVAVPDSAVSEASAELIGSRAQVVLHTCGSLGPAALAPLTTSGVSCATFHPLQTFASREQGVECLTGSTFGICGSGAAYDWAKELCTEFGGSPIAIPEEQLPLYHAAAVIAGNYTIGLVDVAVKLMERAGVEHDLALTAIAPLVRTSVENALVMGPEAGLTGPIERGDSPTIERHIEALRTGPAGSDAVYKAVGRQLVSIARRRGLSLEKAAALEEMLFPQAS